MSVEVNELIAAIESNRLSELDLEYAKRFGASPLIDSDATPFNANFRKHSFEIQREQCFYCGAITKWDDWTIDHRQPLSKGGSNRVGNKVGACFECNHRKADMTEAEFAAFKKAIAAL